MKKQIRLQPMLFLLCALSFGAYGQVQLGGDIDGEAAGDISGQSISLSADGNVLAIGAPHNDGNGTRSGHVRVYKRDATAPLGWRQVGRDIDGEAEDDNSGGSVSLSSDGNVLAIGTSLNDGNGNNSGHVRVYKRDANTPLGWKQLGGDIDGEAADDFSGNSVSLSPNGNVLAIGAPFNNGNGTYSGHVRVYRKVEDAQSPGGFTWEQLGGDIDGEAEGDQSGRGVSLSSDGSVLAIRAPRNDGNGTDSGHVRVYERDAAAPLGWRQVGGDIDGEAAGDRSRSVNLSSDGSLLAIGASNNDGNGERSGHVRVYKRDATADLGWSQLGSDIDGEAADDWSGSSVSLSSDGSVLAIGAIRNNGNGSRSGHVRVYKKVGDAPSPGGFTWEQIGDDIDGGATNNESGTSVSLSSDGSVLAIGAPGNGLGPSFPGYTRVYHIGASGVSIGAPVQVNAMAPFEVTLTFDRGVTGFNQEAIGVTHATVGNFTPVDESTYTATIAPDISICGNITMNVPAGSAFDVDSNLPNFAAREVIVEVMDNVPPNTRTKDIAVALGDNGQVILNADQINDGSTDNCGVDAMFIGSNQVISLEGTFDVELIVEDVNGNRANAFAKVTVEAPPTVSIGNAPSDVQDLEPFTVSITFDKEVTGFEVADIEVAHATVSTLTGSGSTYTATLVPTSLCDDITIDVPTGVATVANSLLHLPNQAAMQVIVAVVDTIDPTITCPADVVANTSDNGAGDCTTTVALGSPVTNDNCAVAAIFAQVNGTEIDPGSYAFGTGTTVVTWTVSDGSGNTTSCGQTVTVIDDEGPTAIAKDITVRLDASGQVTIAPGDVDDGSGSGCDNADPVSLSLDNAVFTCDDVGTPVTVTLTAANGNNSDTATALVTVEANGNCELGPLSDFNRGFSPNGDGIADTLVIEGLEAYKNNVVKVYDLSQRLLFSAHYGGPADAWDGTDRDGLVPVGSYVCIIDYNEPGLGHEAKMIYVNY